MFLNLGDSFETGTLKPLATNPFFNLFSSESFKSLIKLDWCSLNAPESYTFQSFKTRLHKYLRLRSNLRKLLKFYLSQGLILNYSYGKLPFCITKNELSFPTIFLIILNSHNFNCSWLLVLLLNYYFLNYLI